MAHAPGCSPADYVITEAPEGFEWRPYCEVQVGDIDRFGREVIAIQPNKSGTRVRIACGASATTDATLPVEQMVAWKVSDLGLYRTRAA